MTIAKNKFEFRVPAKLDIVKVETTLRERRDVVGLVWTARGALMFSPKWNRKVRIIVQRGGHLQAWMPIEKESGEDMRRIIKLLLQLGAREVDTDRFEVHLRGDLVASLNGVVFRTGGVELSLKRLGDFEELWETIIPRKFAEKLRSRAM